jgi:hypothetical protein
MLGQADAVPSPASTIAVTPHSEGGWHPRCDVGVLDVPLAQVSMREAGMKDQRGFALVATMLVMFLITVVIGAAVTGAAAAIRASNLDYRNSRVFYAAEAGAEAIMAQLHLALEDATLTDEELAAVSPPTLEGFTFGGYNVQKVGGIVVERVTDGAFAGLYSLTQRV